MQVTASLGGAYNETVAGYRNNSSANSRQAGSAAIRGARSTSELEPKRTRQRCSPVLLLVITTNKASRCQLLSGWVVQIIRINEVTRITWWQMYVTQSLRPFPQTETTVREYSLFYKHCDASFQRHWNTWLRFYIFKIACQLFRFAAPATKFNFLSRISRHIDWARRLHEDITKEPNKIRNVRATYPPTWVWIFASSFESLFCTVVIPVTLRACFENKVLPLTHTVFTHSRTQGRI
jgi:hypothetical protein